MTSTDPLTRVGQLQFRWHSRLIASIERRLATAPDDAERAVVLGWADAAAQAATLRGELDEHRRRPADAAVRIALDRAVAKEHRFLAAAAGRAGRIDVGRDPRAVEIGRALEDEARFVLMTSTPARVPSGSAAFVRRLKEALAV